MGRWWRSQPHLHNDIDHADYDLDHPNVDNDNGNTDDLDDQPDDYVHLDNLNHAVCTQPAELHQVGHLGNAARG